MNKLKVMIVGQKWLAEQLLARCLKKPNIEVVTVSPPKQYRPFGEIGNNPSNPHCCPRQNLNRQLSTDWGGYYSNRPRLLFCTKESKG
ncbi:hypothetical protein [Moraxella catarrhalis]|uniref:hypothetical protein n=1 Tax=Moraxella catarrhalis TaxID=480 RepID=UPI001D0D1972|nr:hypothetical protein [Moraxella catarrhalis]